MTRAHSLNPYESEESPSDFRELDSIVNDISLDGPSSSHMSPSSPPGIPVSKTKDKIEEERAGYTTRGLSGLRNLGNTCYMNAILQCLNASEDLNIFIRKEEYLKHLKNNVYQQMKKDYRKEHNLDDDTSVRILRDDFDEACKKTVSYQLTQLLNKFWSHNLIIAPKTFKRTIGRIRPEFMGYGQKDAEELLSLILEKLHDESKANLRAVKFNQLPASVSEYTSMEREYSKAKKRYDAGIISLETFEDHHKRIKLYRREHENDVIVAKACKYWKNEVMKGCSFVTRNFTGLFYSSVRCNECGTSSSAFEAFNVLSVPIPTKANVTIEDCFQKFTEEEDMNGENQYSCDHCDKKTDAKKQMLIWEPPKTLMIQMKRFKHMGMSTSKNSSKVSFPLEGLKINTMFSDIHHYEECEYDLYAVTNHSGGLGGGHYIAYSKNPLNGFWYEFNDSRVTHIADDKVESEVVTNGAYILFYKRRY